MSVTERVVKAKRVREGDFLPGLDNGYVYAAPTDDTDLGFYTNGYVQVSFHTADGDEAYLICPEDTPVTVRRGMA